MNNIYLLPGFGGRLDTVLVGALLQRGFNFSGRETIGDFRALPFDEQVAVVAVDLRHEKKCHARSREVTKNNWILTIYLQEFSCYFQQLLLRLKKADSLPLTLNQAPPPRVKPTRKPFKI